MSYRYGIWIHSTPDTGNTKVIAIQAVTILIDFHCLNTHLEVLFSVHSSAVEYVVVHEHLGLLRIHRIYRSDVSVKDRNSTRTYSLRKLEIKLNSKINQIVELESGVG